MVGLILLLIIIVCIAIMFVKDINPQIKAIAKNIVIIVGILLVIFVLFFFGLVGKNLLESPRGKFIAVPTTPAK